MAIWREQPWEWVESCLGGPKPWTRQREIIDSVAQNSETNVVSGVGVGKDWAVARAVLWWLFTREGIVLTTAPKDDQVKLILWGEVREAYAHARAPLGGDLLPSDPHLRIGPKHYAKGVVAGEVNRLQGFHAENVLVVLDEAAGLHPWVYAGLEGCAVGENDRILRFGNPTCGPDHPFAKECARPDVPGKRKTIRIRSDENPNVVGGYDVIPGLTSRRAFEAARERYGVDHVLFTSRYLAQFPGAASNAFIGFHHLQAARDRLALVPPGARPWEAFDVRIGCDVAAEGDDDTIIWGVQGTHVPRPPRVFHGLDNVQVARECALAAKEWNAVSLAIDGGGLGHGPVAMLRRMREEFGLSEDVSVIDVQFGAAPSGPLENDVANVRTELYWRLRDWLWTTAAFDADEKLAEELIASTWAWSGKRIRLEPKKDLKKRLGRSPDRADGLALAVAGHLVGDAPSMIDAGTTREPDDEEERDQEPAPPPRFGGNRGWR